MYAEVGLAPRSTEFTMAFQPIVDISEGGELFAYEALVRGPNGEGADAILSMVSTRNAVAFDAACRARAVEMAASFGLRCKLSLNVSAAAICDRRFGLHATMRVARQAGFPLGRLIFEMTEHDPIADRAKLGRWMSACRNRGITVALDDFGSGYCALNGLFHLRPEMIKLDMGLVRHIDTDPSRQALVKGIVDACKAFGALVVAEGVETDKEFRTLSKLGIRLMQGYLFAKPGAACLPPIIRPLGLVPEVTCE